MSKVVEYKCNFCGDRKNADQVFGIHWTGVVCGETVNIVPPIDTHNHLCHTCHNAFSRHFVDLHEHEKARADALGVAS